MATLEEKVAQLPPEMQREVRDFIDFLLGKLKRHLIAGETRNAQEKVGESPSESDTDYITDFDWEEEEDEELDTLSIVEENFKDW